MRYREKYDTSSQSTKSYVEDSTNYGAISWVETPSFESSRDFEAMEDVVIPNFFKRRSAGEIFVNPMLQCEMHRSFEPATWYWSGTGPVSADVIDTYTKGTYTNALLNPQNINLMTATTNQRTAFFDTWNTERGQAVAKAWANVDESEILAYATIGELPETVKWIASLYQRFLGLVRMFTAKRVKLEAKRYLAKGRLSFADDLSNFWLEMRYALRPLMFEMEQVVQTLKAQASPPRRTARGYVDLASEEVIDTTWVPRSACLATQKGIVRESHTFRAGVLYDISLEDSDWTHLLALDQPLETIWELTRLSFLVDWFLNIGTLISAWTPNAGLTPLASWVTENHEYSWDIVVTGKLDPGLYVANWTFQDEGSSPGFLKETYKVKRRISDPSRPYFPSISINLDWAKTLDIASIARGLYRSLAR